MLRMIIEPVSAKKKNYPSELEFDLQTQPGKITTYPDKLILR